MLGKQFKIHLSHLNRVRTCKICCLTCAVKTHFAILKGYMSGGNKNEEQKYEKLERTERVMKNRVRTGEGGDRAKGERWRGMKEGKGKEEREWEIGRNGGGRMILSPSDASLIIKQTSETLASLIFEMTHSNELRSHLVMVASYNPKLCKI